MGWTEIVKDEPKESRKAGGEKDYLLESSARREKSRYEWTKRPSTRR